MTAYPLYIRLSASRDVHAGRIRDGDAETACSAEVGAWAPAAAPITCRHCQHALNRTGGTR